MVDVTIIRLLSKVAVVAYWYQAMDHYLFFTSWDTPDKESPRHHIGGSFNVPLNSMKAENMDRRPVIPKRVCLTRPQLSFYFEGREVRVGDDRKGVKQENIFPHRPLRCASARDDWRWVRKTLICAWPFYPAPTV